MAVVAVVDTDYWHWVPLFVHSANFAYPEYTPVIFGHGDQPESVRNLCVGMNCQIYPHALDDYIQSPLGTKCARWLFNHPALHEFRTVWMCDVDHIVIREEVSIQELHLLDCVKEGLCYSNTFHGEGPERGLRMMGNSHFYVVEPYLEKMTPIIAKYQHLVKTDEGMAWLKSEWFNHLLGRADNQNILYRLIVEARLGLPQETLNPLRVYHGVHLGHSREPGRWELFCKQQTDFRTMPGPIAHYYHHFLELESTAKYQTLYDAAPKFVTESIDTFDKACELTL